MEVINLSSRSFKGLRTLELPNTVYNTEGKIYIFMRIKISGIKGYI